MVAVRTRRVNCVRLRVRSTRTYHRAVVQACAASEGCLRTIGVSRPKVLLLLGHMRSGSTLLLHLLLTNPEIASLGERNAVYASRKDFSHLAIAARLARRTPFGHMGYVADQVNHTRFTPVPALLADSRLRLVFLLRRPEASLGSLLELSRNYYRASWSVDRAVDYYATRLDELAALARSIPSANRAAFVRYEELTESPETTLENLRRFLGLSQPSRRDMRSSRLLSDAAIRVLPSPPARLCARNHRASISSATRSRCGSPRLTSAAAQPWLASHSRA